MTRIYITTAIAFAAIVAGTAHAAPNKAQTFKLERGTVSFEMPQGWMGQPNSLDMPLVIYGPMKDESRPVISVVPSGENVEIGKNFGETEYEYRMSRREALEKGGAEVLGFAKYDKTKLNGNEAHTLGVRYRIGGDEFAENSWYVVCKNKFYFLKSLNRDPASDRAVEGVVKSFQCE